MRTYEEMVSEFASFDVIGKEKWINNLVLEEMKNFRAGLNNVHIHTPQDWIRYWISYIDVEISNRIGETREERLKGLGI
jgi:hypothetical protein